MKCFSVFDTKANVFGVPFFALTVGVASRLFADLVADFQSTVNRYPADFSVLPDFMDAQNFLILEAKYYGNFRYNRRFNNIMIICMIILLNRLLYLMLSLNHSMI